MPVIIGKINVPVTMTVQQPGDWYQLKTEGVPTVNLRIALDRRSAGFTPSINGTYKFQCSSATAPFEVQVGTPVEPEEPEEPEQPENPTEEGLVLIYDSKDFWKGPRRMVTEIEGDDKIPDSGYIRPNASGHPKVDVLGDEGDCHAVLINEKGPADDPVTFGRFYLGKCTYNTMMERTVAILSDSMETDSTKFGRHQYRDVVDKKAPDSKVQGGVGFHVKRNEAGTSVEIVHGNEGDDIKKPLPTNIKTGEFYNTRYWVWHTEDKRLLVKHQIEYPIGTGYKTVINQEMEAPDQFFNEAEFLAWSEIWVGRGNGEGGKIEYARVRVYKLTKKPADMK